MRLISNAPLKEIRGQKPHFANKEFYFCTKYCFERRAYVEKHTHATSAGLRAEPAAADDDDDDDGGGGDARVLRHCVLQIPLSRKA